MPASDDPTGSPGPAVLLRAPSPAVVAARARHALLFFRLGLGVVWALNLIYVVDPANQFFSTFSVVAGSFASTSVDGGAVATFAAGHPLPFALVVAGITAYLAVAFLLGLTTRWACVVGAGFNAALLWTQFGSLTLLPGGTDVGPHPLYLLAYAVLLIGHGPDRLSVDSWILRRSQRSAAVDPNPSPAGLLATGSELPRL